MNKNIELITRAIIIKDDKILLCKSKGQNVYFLPGGHVEFGETAEKALAREILEELGTTCGEVKYLCAIENIFKQGDEKKHEINFLFRINPIEPFTTTETHIEFMWAKTQELNKLNLKPSLLKNFILQIQNIKPTLLTHIE